MDTISINLPRTESADPAALQAAMPEPPAAAEETAQAAAAPVESNNGSEATSTEDGGHIHTRQNSMKDLIMKAKMFEQKHANEVPLRRQPSMNREGALSVKPEPDAPAATDGLKTSAAGASTGAASAVGIATQKEEQVERPQSIATQEPTPTVPSQAAGSTNATSRPNGRRAAPMDPTATSNSTLATSKDTPAAATAPENGTQKQPPPGSNDSPRDEALDIYISFRAEAANESRSLRRALRHLDRKVYLNASKEETIGNWLREMSAVRKASVMVAMVSATYGEDGGLMEVMPTWEELKQAIRFKKPICVVFMPGVEGISRTLTSSGIDKTAMLMTRWDNGASSVANEISGIVEQVEEEKRRKAEEAKGSVMIAGGDDAQSALVTSDLKRFLYSLNMSSSFRTLRSSGITSIPDLVKAVEKVSRGDHNLVRSDVGPVKIEDLSAAKPGEAVSYLEAEQLLRSTVGTASDFTVVLDNIAEWALDEHQGAAMASRHSLVEVLCGGLLIHRRDPDTQATGARAMANLMRPFGYRANDMVASRGDVMAGAGGVSVLVKAIEAHANNEVVCEHCFKALMDIAVSETNEVLIKNLDGDKAVVAGITKHAYNTAVVVNGIKALANMRVEQPYAINALLSAIKYHANQEAIQKFGAWALKNVEWYKNPTLVEIAEREHVIEIMENIKLRFADKEDISKQANELLEILRTCISARDKPSSARRGIFQ